MSAKTIAYLVLAVLLLVILFQNTQVVTFRLLFWQFSMSHIILIFLLLLAGFLLGLAAGGVFALGWKKRHHV